MNVRSWSFPLYPDVGSFACVASTRGVLLTTIFAVSLVFYDVIASQTGEEHVAAIFLEGDITIP
jgi:hypothetical protein